MGFWLTHGPVARGEVHRFDGTPIPGRAGLHARARLLDALPLGKGDWLCRVELGGTVVRADGQLAATLRRVHFARPVGDALAPAVRAAIERALGEPLQARAEHHAAAERARDRVLEASGRARDARWVLEHGRVEGLGRARAEGELAGAECAAAEARSVAELHEAAVALLDDEVLSGVVRAVEHLVAANAALVPDARAAEVRVRLDEALTRVILATAPADLAPLDEGGLDAGAPAGEEQAVAPPRAIAEGTARRGPAPSVASVASRPSARGWLELPAPLEPIGPPATEILARLFATLDGVEPLDVHALVASPERDGRAALLLRAADEAAARALLARLEQDDVLASAPLDFVAAWDPAAGDATWYVVGARARALASSDPFSRSAVLLDALTTPAADVRELTAQGLELMLSWGVVRAGVCPGRAEQPDVLALEVEDEASLRVALGRLARAGVGPVVARASDSDEHWGAPELGWGEGDEGTVDAALARAWYRRTQPIPPAARPAPEPLELDASEVRAAPLALLEAAFAGFSGAIHYVDTSSEGSRVAAAIAVRCDSEADLTALAAFARSELARRWRVGAVGIGPRASLAGWRRVPMVVPHEHGGESRRRALAAAALDAQRTPSLRGAVEPLADDALRFCLHAFLRCAPEIERARWLTPIPALAACVTSMDAVERLEKHLFRRFPEIAWLAVVDTPTAAEAMVFAREGHPLLAWPSGAIDDVIASLVGNTVVRRAVTPMRVPEPSWVERSPSPTGPRVAKAWTSALATAIERGFSVGLRCPRCALAYDLPAEVPLERTRCAVCQNLGLVGTPRTSPSTVTREVRCPSCAHPFLASALHAHARCDACGLAVVPVARDRS